MNTKPLLIPKELAQGFVNAWCADKDAFNAFCEHLGYCCFYFKDGRRWVAIDNDGGECYVEEFTKKIGVFLFFRNVEKEYIKSWVCA